MKKILLPLFVSTGLFAQTVEDIRFEGLVHLSEITAQNVAGIKKGETLNYNKVNKAIKEFFEYGYFEDIIVSYDAGVLHFNLVEKPIISRVEMSGYKERDSEDILKHLKLSKGQIFDNHKKENARREILALLEYEGYYDSVVDFETKREGNSIEVDVVVRTGEKIIIEELEFEGTDKLSDSKIEQQLTNKEREFMGWMWGRNDGVAKVAALPQDKQKIQEYYLKHGYLDATIEDGVLETEFGGYKAKQKYKIYEGEQYRVGNVTINQEKQLIDDEIELSLENGDVFNLDKFRKDSETLKTMFADLGYAYTRVNTEVLPNNETKTVDITYDVQPNQKVYINDVIVSGNLRTIDRVIRREVFLAPGDLYSVTDLTDSKNALNRTGYFENVEIIEKRVASDKIDLEIKVKEQPTGSIVLGAGYGSYDGFLYNVQLSDRNILGTGLDVGIDIEKSDKRNEYDVYLTNPRVWDSEYSAGFSVFNKDYTAYEYEEESRGGSVFVGRKLGRHWAANTRLLYVDYDVKYDDNRRVDVKYDKVSIIPAINFNNTDNYYFPRNGLKFSTSLEVAGLAGDSEFIKSNTNFSAFYGLQELINYDLILRYKARLGYVSDRGYLNINEKFYMGGMGTVRGYGSGSLSPRDANDYRTGGEKMFANSIEASIPLIESANMRLAFFYDYGMIGDNSFNEIKRSSTGAAIEWLSPMGAIQLIFAQPIDDESGDDTSTFEFNLGTTF